MCKSSTSTKNQNSPVLKKVYTQKKAISNDTIASYRKISAVGPQAVVSPLLRISNTWLLAPRAYALSSVIRKWFKSQLCCSCSNYPYSGWFCGLIDYHQGICCFSATEDVEGKKLNKCFSLIWQLPKYTYMHVRILFLQREKVKTWRSLKLKTHNSTDFLSTSM